MFWVLHALPQPEQWAGSERVSVSQPFAAFPSQLPQPESHRILQSPATHTAAPWTSAHIFPQEPQLFLLVARLASHPLSAMPSQSAQPALQDLIMHTPPKQEVTALGNEQVHPHWLGTPPPPQVSGASQEPQSALPHPVSTGPQLAPS
jgi:hypothetical protein